eukprot:Pgem_evm1s7427
MKAKRVRNSGPADNINKKRKINNKVSDVGNKRFQSRVDRILSSGNVKEENNDEVDTQRERDDSTQSDEISNDNVKEIKNQLRHNQHHDRQKEQSNEQCNFINSNDVDDDVRFISVQRRKMFDEVMSTSFVIGNTNARSLLTSEEAQRFIEQDE